MNPFARWLERRRAAVRREVNEDDGVPAPPSGDMVPGERGGDDQQGAVADDVPDASPAARSVRSGGRSHIPPGIELAAGWSWRLLVIGAAAIATYEVLAFFSEFTVPIAVAVLVCALLVPFVELLERLQLPRGAAAGIVVLGAIAVVGGMLTLAGQQISTQVDELRTSVVEGITQVQNWAKTGPLNLSDAQVQDWIDRGKAAISSENGQVVSRATEVGTTVTAVLASTFIALFATYFFLYDGNRIWSWVVSIFPRQARPHVDSSGRVAWVSLTAFVRATVIVASTDALGIAVGAWLLGVPLALAIGVLVFLGAFVPIVGALVSGMVAVLVALVAQGPWTALIMLIIVVAMQQFESHVLQPFLMGRLVALHPLAIILAIAAGLTVSGIVGALVAVPLAACSNAVVRHVAAGASGTPSSAGPAPSPPSP